MSRYSLIAGAVALLLVVSSTQTRPPYKQALIDLLGADLPAKMRDCRACHISTKPEEDAPHNLFGSRLKELRTTLRKAGKKNDITSRLLAALDEDSDRDGTTNAVELISGHNPGDTKDKPEAAAVNASLAKYTAWKTARQSGNLWQPFDPVERPAVPIVRNSSWIRNPIDAFLAVEHERRSLQPRSEAPRAVLLRRVYLDLIGLPPTREELQAFLDDRSPDAYEKVVDRLLASPRHGERWGRHWMDVWRYSDWAGYGAEVRDSQKHMWHWRDWIIESLNKDKPYDRMIQEMLAADELAPTDRDSLRATGFLVRNWYLFNRNVWLDRIVEHTGKAFLGVTLNCAKCHDHFYDPITMPEYYAFRAIFEPHKVRTDRLPTSADINVNGLPRVYDAELNTPTYLFERGNEAAPDKSKVIAPAVPVSLGGSLTIEPVSLPRTAYQPDRQDFLIEQALAAARIEVEQTKANLPAIQRLYLASTVPPSRSPGLIGWFAVQHRLSVQKQVAELASDLAHVKQQELQAQLEIERLEDSGKTNSPEWTTAARKVAGLQRQREQVAARQAVASAELALLQASAKTRATASNKLSAAKKALTQVEARAKTPVTTAYQKRAITTYPATSTGRRLALARWITDRQNPLTARVLINHVWLRHFGKALVPSEFDFGKNGQPATHPALVNWLASEFMDRQWSMKTLHRLIVTSAAYRMDSSANETMLAKDPDNRYLWRMNPRRMEGEIVRDSLLMLADRLDLTMSGPDIDHKLGLTVPRRSLYFRHAAEKQMEFLALFDAPSVNECYRRTESIIPQQALALSNSTLAVGMSRVIAGQLQQQLGERKSSEEPFLRLAFEHVLGRQPTTQEIATCQEFLTQQRSLFADPKQLTGFTTGTASTVPASSDPGQRARENLVHVLVNLHEFVMIR